MVTLVERHSRHLLVLPISTASSWSVIAALCQAFAAMPETMRYSPTWDRGIEMTRHAEFSSITGVPVFFCDAYSPCQRGSNENTNGLLRQYFPTKTELSIHTPDEIQAVVNQPNDRPRAALNWKTPFDRVVSA
ncbi:IS30 family transposase [Streptomyces sp. NPDC001982]|uniref:IS30 family transposase n=1 Tax=Streptomyces sp. NPDC001982 TaxID=3154405 RepID=UPI003332EEE3